MSARSLFTRSLLRTPAARAFGMTASPSPTILPSDIPIEEERIPGYSPRNFYPVNPGDLLNRRYRILSKVGWGTTSTVWLAQDTRRWWWNSNRYVALKVAVCGFDDEIAATHERNITRSLTVNPSHNGFTLIRAMLDDFEVVGPAGKHLCLVYELMREPLWLFQKRTPSGKIPPPLLKVYVKFFLRALDYLHSECKIIHTDLKMDNILVGFEDPSILEDYVEAQDKNPMPRKVGKDGRLVYLSHNDFGPLKSFRVIPKIADFGLARSGDVNPTSLSFPIQPRAYQAPEVMLGTGWGYSTDIWNLGVLIWNMLEGRDLFEHVHLEDGKYDVRAHLAEMIALMGPPPQELLERERLWAHVEWDRGFPNLDGKLCYNSREYFGGPFFDSDGEFMYKDLIPTGVSLEGSVSSLDTEDDKQLFMDFVKNMLQWQPQDRKTAKELLEHPWLVL